MMIMTVLTITTPITMVTMAHFRQTTNLKRRKSFNFLVFSSPPESEECVSISPHLVIFSIVSSHFGNI
jgi:hypothetical protein